MHIIINYFDIIFHKNTSRSFYFFKYLLCLLILCTLSSLYLFIHELCLLLFNNNRSNHNDSNLVNHYSLSHYMTLEYITIHFRNNIIHVLTFGIFVLSLRKMVFYWWNFNWVIIFTSLSLWSTLAFSLSLSWISASIAACYFVAKSSL